MYIIFDATEFNFLRYTLFTPEQEIQTVIEQKNKQLLVEFDLFLKENDKTLDNIKGIAVILGKGSFTSTRITVTVANTLALTKNILVLGIEYKPNYSYSQLQELFLNIKPHQYIHAIYSGKPNIN